MAYRCNYCRHTSAPFPIARSEWDMKQNNHFCPDCQHNYTLATNKYPNHPSPVKLCNCGCKPCCCRSACSFKPYMPIKNVDHCHPPHPSVHPHPHPVHPVVPPHPVIPADSKTSLFFY